MTITSKHSIYCFPALGSIRMKFVPGGSLPHREIKKPYDLCGLITLSEITFPCLTVNVYSFALLKCACQMAVYSYLLPLEEILWPWRGGGAVLYPLLKLISSHFFVHPVLDCDVCSSRALKQEAVGRSVQTSATGYTQRTSLV